MTRPSDLIHGLASRLAAAGFPSPGADARWLVAHCAGLEVSQLLARWELSDDEVRCSHELLERRLAGEPVQHITGAAFFRQERLHVGPGVFIPRPETELLAGWAITFLARRPVGRRRCVEPCAGSGAITRAVLGELGGVVAHVNERSAAAEPYLRKNLAGLPVEIEMGDMADAFVELDARADLVVANPPYVPSGVRHLLPPDVLGRDPDEALFAGEDGLDAIRVVIRLGVRVLVAGGGLAVEHDEGHQEQVRRLFRTAGFDDVTGHRDLTGRERFVTGVRAADADRAVAGWDS